MYTPNSTWSWAFLSVVVGQAIIGLALEGYVFGKFIVALMGKSHTAEVKAIDTFLSLFLFGFLYQIVLTYDALRLKNTIQVIGLCAYNLGLIIYAAVQVSTVHDAINSKQQGGEELVGAPLWPELRPFLVAIPCICTFFVVILSGIAWKLYDEFAWSIYKHISADVRMRKRFLIYQVYITILKFDLFFFLSFTVQFTVVVLETRDIEFGLTIAALPVTIIILALAGYWTRKENVAGMIGTITLYIGALAYFFFKLIRMYDDSTPQARSRVEKYLPARKGLTTFAVITIGLLIATIINAIWCTMNFGKGLKPHLRDRKVPDHEDKVYNYDNNSNYNGTVPLGQVSTRMTID